MSDAKVMPVPIEKYQALLAKDFPELGVKSIRYLGSGWGNAAMLVNDEYVFRFPRGLFEADEPIKTSDIKKEVNILNFLSGKLSFATPKPDFVAPDCRYFGYKLLAGKLWDRLPQAQQSTDALLQSWVETRCELAKAVPIENAAELGLRRYHTDKNVKFVQQYINDPQADERVKAMAQKAMGYVLANLRENGNWVFVHEDLQMSNCFISKDAQKISGVIDFGDSEIAPVEADFYFWSKWGRPMLEKVAKLQTDYDGTPIDVDLAQAMHQFYIVADYQDFATRGFDQAADHKWHQIERYLENG